MTRRTLLAVWAGLALALVAPFHVLAAVPMPRLESTLSIDKADLTTADEVTVGFTLTNTGRLGARLLRWQTPLFAINDDLFEVTRDGTPVAYLGRHVRRPEPRPSDYLDIKPGETLTATVPLSSLYDFSRPGAYTVRYRVTAVNPLARTAAESVVEVAASGVLALTLGGDDLSEQLAEALRNRSTRSLAAFDTGDMSTSFVAPGFVGCPNSRRTTIRSALGGAQGQTTSSLSYLNAGQRDSRYTTWFGAYSSSRYSSVRNKIARMDSALRNQTVVFDCGCTEDWYAYVFSDDPYTIHLCNAFWPASNPDKFGTITHEISHFTVVAGSEDIVYGVQGCQDLARTNPGAAIRNADSLAYFGY